MNANAPTASRPASSSSFHDDDADTLPDYHTLSVLAVIGLLFGLAAPLCFTAPVMVAVPLFGIAISLVALRRIATSQGVLAGRWVAAVGLALCIASLVALVSYSRTRQWLQVAQAEELGRKWLELVLAGDTQQAFRLTISGAEPPPAAGEPGATRTNPYDDFRANPVIQRLTDVGADADVRLEETVSYEPRTAGMGLVQQRFTVVPPPAEPGHDDGHEPSLHVDLRFQRARLYRELYPRWLVVSYSSPDVAPSADSHGHSHAHD